MSRMFSNSSDCLPIFRTETVFFCSVCKHTIRTRVSRLPSRNDSTYAMGVTPNWALVFIGVGRDSHREIDIHWLIPTKEHLNHIELIHIDLNYIKDRAYVIHFNMIHMVLEGPLWLISTLHLMAHLPPMIIMDKGLRRPPGSYKAESKSIWIISMWFRGWFLIWIKSIILIHNFDAIQFDVNHIYPFNVIQPCWP